MYAIIDPLGRLRKETTASSRTKAWELAYEKLLYKTYAYAKNPTKAAYRNGWRCVEVMVSRL